MKIPLIHNFHEYALENCKAGLLQQSTRLKNTQSTNTIELFFFV